MNKQIDQIADQVMSEFHDVFKGSGIVVSDEFFERFAQLIVAECAQLVQGVPVDTMGYHTADQKIKEHFGIK